MKLQFDANQQFQHDAVSAVTNLFEGSVPLEAWELFDTAANIARRCPHFSVEMEIGTSRACRLRPAQTPAASN
jgi:hypothetical protein